MKYHASPNFVLDTDDPEPTLDKKIEIFEGQVRGWQLDVARRLVESDPNGGYGVLAILMSYPEKIWQYVNGKSSKDGSRLAFREGMSMIFNTIKKDDPRHNAAVDHVYDTVRNGMYHNGGPKPGVVLSETFQVPIAIVNDEVQINPHLLPGAFSDHLGRYLTQVKDPRNELARVKFEKMYGRV